MRTAGPDPAALSVAPGPWASAPPRPHQHLHVHKRTPVCVRTPRASLQNQKEVGAHTWVHHRPSAANTPSQPALTSPIPLMPEPLLEEHCLRITCPWELGQGRWAFHKHSIFQPFYLIHLFSVTPFVNKCPKRCAGCWVSHSERDRDPCPREPYLLMDMLAKHKYTAKAALRITS